MAVGGAFCSPFGIDRAERVFDGVERLLHEVLHLLRRRVFGVAVVVAEAGIADPERVGPEILAELEVFVKAEAVAGPVAPEIHRALALRDGADGVFPLDAVVEVQPADDGAAGESDKRRLQIGERLGEVGPQAVRPALERVAGKQRHHIEPDRPGAIERERQPSAAVAAFGLQTDAIFLPPAADIAHDRGGVAFAAVGALQRNSDIEPFRALGARVKGQVIPAPATMFMPQNPPLATPARPPVRSPSAASNAGCDH
jgi:hypothetical protein